MEPVMDWNWNDEWFLEPKLEQDTRILPLSLNLSLELGPKWVNGMGM